MTFNDDPDAHDIRKRLIEDEMIYRERKTIFSPCRKWRYTLWRGWKVEPCQNHSVQSWANCIYCLHRDEYVQFIGLNPSTADETQDDPTIRRCINFAKSWGFGAMCMTNLFAWRDMDPEKMKATQDPVGADNNKWLLEIASGAGLIIGAWGNHGAHLGRSEMVCNALLKIGHEIKCLGVNSSMEPKHPLYLSSKTKPMAYKTPQLAIVHEQEVRFAVGVGGGKIE